MIKSLVGGKVGRLEKEMQGLAGQAIKLIEEKLVESLGVEVKVGVEIEGVAIRRPEDLDNPDRILNECEISLSFNERVVEKFCRENGKSQYEFATAPLPPSVAALAVVKLKELAISKADEYGLEGFSFNPFKEEGAIGSGIHVNISLWRGEEPLFYFEEVDGLMVPSNLMLHAASERALLMQDDSLFCVAMSDDGYKRFDKSRFSPKFICASTQEDKGDRETIVLRHSQLEFGGSENLSEKQVRVENRLPGADADPYLAVLTTMAAIYAGIKDKVALKKGNLVVSEDVEDISAAAIPIKSNREDAFKQFVNEGSSFKELLNDLSPGLGAALVDKVTEYAEAKYHVTLAQREATGVSR